MARESVRDRQVPIPEELQLLNAARLAEALDVSHDTVRELWDRRVLPYVTVTATGERSKRCTSLADLRAFQAARYTPRRENAA